MYYILCFIVVMLPPVAMFLLGLKWRLSPPPFRKKGVTFNTELSRKDPDAWALAHRHCGKLWIRIGLLTGVVSAVLMGYFSDSYQAFWLWLLVGQMALFCVSVFLVDALLKATYGAGPEEDPEQKK